MNLPKNSGTQVAGENAGADGVQPRRLSRRHLLKGIAGGSAALAAVRPIESLATSSPILKVQGQNNVCSISGMQSAGTSPRPGSTYCYGKSPGYYNQSNIANWPGYNSTYGYATIVVGGVSYRSYNLAKNLFTKFSNSTYSLVGIMPGSPPNAAASDEMHWLAAILNAIKFPSTSPYTVSEIMAFYNSPTAGTTYQNALSFYMTTPYLEA